MPMIHLDFRFNIMLKWQSIIKKKIKHMKNMQMFTKKMFYIYMKFKSSKYNFSFDHVTTIPKTSCMNKKYLLCMQFTRGDLTTI